MDVIANLATLGGAARWSELIAHGATRAEIDAAVRAGFAARVSRGVFALPDAPAAAVVAARLGGVVTCVSALRLLRLPVLGADSDVHVATAAGSAYARAPGNARVHRLASRPRDGLATRAGAPRLPVRANRIAPLAIALAHASRCLGDDELLAAVDGALNSGLVGLGDVAQLPGVAASARARILARCDPRAESPLETIARIDLVAAGLACWPQARIAGVGRVDLLVAGRVIVELDGREFHTRREAFARDRDRDRVASELGYVTLRFTGSDVLRRQGAVVRAVRAVLDR